MRGGQHLETIAAAVALAAEKGAGSNTPTTTIIVGLAGVLLGGVIAGGFRLAGDRVARRAEAQRNALYELQDTARRLRNALRSYGKSASPTVALEEAVDEETSTLEIHVERVNCDGLRTATTAWRRLAERYFTGDPLVAFHQEDALWRTLQKHAGQDLRRLDRGTFSWARGQRCGR